MKAEGSLKCRAPAAHMIHMTHLCSRPMGGKGMILKLSSSYGESPTKCSCMHNDIVIVLLLYLDIYIYNCVSILQLPLSPDGNGSVYIYTVQ